MPCYHPIHGWRGRNGTFTTNPKNTWEDLRRSGKISMTIPCGKCDGCKADYFKQWAMRCYHESKVNERNCFITLTYNDDNLPVGYNLIKSDLQDYFKRLRSHFDYYDTGIKFKYYACGEYGDLTLRPHYHILLFGYCPDDCRLIGYNNETGGKNYESLFLNQFWNKGFTTVTPELNYEMCSYVARYVSKKLLKDKEYYESIKNRTEPFTISSRRPSIGFEYYTRFFKEIQRDDEIVLNGNVVKPPRYYDKLTERFDPETMKHIKIDRLKSIMNLSENELDELAHCKGIINKSIKKQLIRGM